MGKKLHITVKLLTHPMHDACILHSKIRRDDIDFPIIYFVISFFHFVVDHNILFLPNYVVSYKPQPNSTPFLRLLVISALQNCNILLSTTIMGTSFHSCNKRFSLAKFKKKIRNKSKGPNNKK